jgi:tRNA pseudouridine32 synthase/23S rRNA pseudouridine746 synthase
LAAEEVKHEIERINPSEGKMFGVLVVEGGFLAAYSGLLEGRNDWPYFVPPVFDAQQPDGYFKQKEREISLTTHLSPLASKPMSQDLQLWLFRQYRLLNAKGEKKDLVDIWQDYHTSPKIRHKYPLPPGGTGDCCAPKLLQYAYQHDLKPVCMAEFWWGPSPKSEIRHHGQFYPACRGKCLPVLTWMLQGLEVDPNPDETKDRHLMPKVVYEDEVLAVIDKPSGMLSAPGCVNHYSVASWAQERWEGALLVHRLDMMTSGLILVAKTEEAYHHLQKQFETRVVKKKYLALVEGIPKQEHGVIDLPLASDPMNRPRQMVDNIHGKRAITEYRVLRTYQGKSLLALWPHTGRTHQLRMHCAHPDGLQCPMVGDELYGHTSDVGLCLQANAITFTHPTTGKKMHFELPPLWHLS